MPGVLILECMAQVGGCLFFTGVDEPGKTLMYLSGVDKARFRRPVFPGDQLIVDAEIVQVRSNIVRLKADARVDGALCAEGEFMQQSRQDAGGGTLMAIHVTAVVDPSASVHADAEVGPYAIVGARVTIGARTVVGAHAVIEGPTTLGEDNRVSPQAALGGPPQDLKYKGEPTTLTIGNRNTFREFCTIHRGTMTGHGTTIIGDDNLFMAYSHVAHDCVVGNRTVFANGASLAGHCVVGDDVVLGAFAAVRQFLRIGRHAFVGAFSGMNHDVLPFLWSSSDRDVRAWKVNSVGLERKGFSKERVAALQKAYRVLHRHRHDKAALLAGLEPLAATSEDVKLLRDFVAESTQGIHGA